MANTNIINAVFGSGICAVTTSAFRANYGMVLRFSGIDLPTAFEVDFSNYDTMGRDSITAIGQDNEVQIPDQLWDSGLNIYAYVYLHPTDDSGVTVYTVTIPVLGRPNRTEEQPTPHEQSVIEQAISALNDAVEQTAADVETTTANAQAAAQSEANAATSERSAAASAGAALASQNAAESASQSATESASGAAESARNAANSAAQAAQSASASSESARNAANSAAQAAQSATDAQEYAEQAEQSAQSISGDVERAESAAATATEKATEAATSATTANGAAQTASSKANEASASATAAAQSASSAASSAQNAASSAQSAESSATAAADSANLSRDYALSNARHYGARWDKLNAQMVRTGLAASITTDLTNFRHWGAKNANYNNPFDAIYPWSGCRLCNIDLDVYLALSTGDDITACVVAWEGDPDFSYDRENGVWKYIPEFWGKSWDDGDYRYFDICDLPIGGYVHYPQQIVARWRGVSETRTVNGTDKTVLLPKLGMPAKRIAMSTLHTYAKNANMTLDSVYSLDASILMCIIEAANYNVQNSWGSGVSALYREDANDLIAEAATDSTVVKVKKANAAPCIPNAIFDIGTAKGGVQVGSFYIVSVADDANDSTLLDVTLDRAATVTTANYWSIHGRVNVADEEIGSQSGYIGTNGKADAYYRGEVFWGNMWLYILGAYHQANTNHVFVAKNDKESDNYDVINTAAHIDTGVELASTNGYIKSLGFPTRSGLLAAPALCTAVGGSSLNPVGDYFYIAVSSNTVLIVGGDAYHGEGDGLCWGWRLPAGYSTWSYAARPRLKNP